MTAAVVFAGIPTAAVAVSAWVARVVMLKVALKDVPPEKRAAIIRALFGRRGK
ncbi:hypothetical protein NS2_72000 [Nocardia seriolae NBRC 15557]|nr:hypothetical protein NS2_72000 [Nocardia seriolae NBRC 15557]